MRDRRVGLWTLKTCRSSFALYCLYRNETRRRGCNGGIYGHRCHEQRQEKRHSLLSYSRSRPIVSTTAVAQFEAAMSQKALLCRFGLAISS